MSRTPQPPVRFPRLTAIPAPILLAWFLTPAGVPAAGLFAAGGAGQEAPEGNAAARCEQAAQAADWEAAVTECEAARAAFPESFGIRYFLGFAYEARESWSRAADAFAAFLEAVREREDAGTRFGEQIALATRRAALARYRAGEYAAAVPLLREAAGADPADAESAFFLGMALLEQGDAAASEEAFLGVIEVSPGTPPPHFFVGRFRYEAGDYPAAEAHLLRFLEIAPGSPLAADALWMAGSVALRESSPGRQPEETADEGTDEAVGEGAGEGPNEAATGRPGEEGSAARGRAVERFRRFLELEGEGDRAAAAHYFLGAFAADGPDCAGAERHYRRFLELAPDHGQAEEVRRYLREAAASCEPPPAAPPDRREGW